MHQGPYWAFKTRPPALGLGRVTRPNSENRVIQKPDAHRTLSSVTRPIDCDWESRTLAVTLFHVQPQRCSSATKSWCCLFCVAPIGSPSTVSSQVLCICLIDEVWAGHNTQMFMWIFHLSRYSNPPHKVLITTRNFFMLTFTFSDCRGMVTHAM